MEDITLWPKLVSAICIHYENHAEISTAQNFVYNDKFRHIRGRNNTVRQLLSKDAISINFVASKDNLVNSLTKYLSGEHVNYVFKGIRLKVLPY